ncbi:MAG: PadR family transcriptional regulator, partial [Chloroflexi bacterium]|nr:PadR family transcriptional regulator [Chloroflexota bacterium]
EMLAKPAKEYHEFMVALSFLAAVPSEVVLRALQVRAALLEGEIAGQRAMSRALVDQLPRLVLLEMEYMLTLREAEFAWIQALLDDLRSGKLTWTPEALQAEFGDNPPSEE